MQLVGTNVSVHIGKIGFQTHIQRRISKPISAHHRKITTYPWFLHPNSQSFVAKVILPHPPKPANKRMDIRFPTTFIFNLLNDMIILECTVEQVEDESFREHGKDTWLVLAPTTLSFCSKFSVNKLKNLSHLNASSNQIMWKKVTGSVVSLPWDNQPLVWPPSSLQSNNVQVIKGIETGRTNDIYSEYLGFLLQNLSSNVWDWIVIEKIKIMGLRHMVYIHRAWFWINLGFFVSIELPLTFLHSNDVT